MQNDAFRTDPSHPNSDQNLDAWPQTVNPQDLVIDPQNAMGRPRFMQQTPPSQTEPVAVASDGPTFPLDWQHSAHDEQWSPGNAAVVATSAEGSSVLGPSGPNNSGLSTSRFPTCNEESRPSSSKTNLRVSHRCRECGSTGTHLTDLDYHAAKTGHTPFACSYQSCESEFTRSDSLKRHIARHLESQPRYECPHCYKHTGDKAFKRRDHLTQHLRGYHNIGVEAMISKANSCPHMTCDQYRPGVFAMDGSPIFKDGHRVYGYVVADEDQAFKSTKAFQDHMRKSHNETPFQCPVSGCDRKGAKGWFRKREFIKHHQKDHGGELPELDLPKWFVS